MNRSAALALLLLVSCGPQVTNSKKVTVPLGKAPSYEAEHAMQFSFSNVSKEAFDLNTYTLNIQRSLAEANIENFFNVDFSLLENLRFGVQPIREAMANDVINSLLPDIQKKLNEVSNPQVKVDLEILVDFLTSQKKLNQIKLDENKVDLYFALLAPIINLQLLETAEDSVLKKNVTQQYLKDMVENDLYGNLVKEFTKRAENSPIKLSEDKFNGVKSATMFAESHFKTLERYINQYTMFDVDMDLVRKLKTSYVDAHKEIAILLSKGKIQNAGTKISKKEYQALLKTHGVYLKADKMYKLAKATLDSEYKKFLYLSQQVSKLKGIKKFSVKNLTEYYRKNELVRSDEELKEYVDSANEDIENIVKEGGLLTLPKDPTVVFFAGLTDGELGDILKSRAAHGVPQMIDSLPIASEKPFALWPEVKVMKKKLPDFIIKPSIHGVSAHEGRPGHEMQFLSIQLSDYRSIIRHKLIQNTANVEGWGLYSEKIIEEQLDDNQLERKLFYKINYLFRIIRVITDYEIAMGKMTPSEGIAFYMDKLGVAKGTAESEIERRLQNPGRDTGYFVGRHAIEQLKKRVIKNEKYKYSNECFNDLVIRFSFAPAHFVEKIIGLTDNCLKK